MPSKLRSPWRLGGLLGKKKEDKAADADGSSGRLQARMAQQRQGFLCPIMEQVMQDPVVCGDGYTYERRAIEVRTAQTDHL